MQVVGSIVVAHMHVNDFLRELLDEIVEIYIDNIEKTNMKFKSNLEYEQIPIVADKKQIGRVITNLIDNAIKFSNDNGIVQLNSYQKENHVTIEITDNGVGIDSKDIPMIFEPYYRSPESQNKSGYGIGLTIVKKIVWQDHHAEYHWRFGPG